MYNTSNGLFIGIAVSMIFNLLLGASIKNYEPTKTKRKKYDLVEMKINKIKKEEPKVEPIKEEIKVEEVKKEEPKKEEKKVVKKEIKKEVKKEEIKKEEVKKEIPKNPIDEKKEEVKEIKKTSTPIFGVNMNSTIQGQGGSFQVQVGNTLMTDSKTGWENGKPKEVLDYDPDAIAIKDTKKTEEVKKIIPPVKIKSKALPKKVIKPVYTKEAKEAEIEGQIILKITIEKDGSVKAAEVLKGLGYGLDEEAVKAVKQFLFEPAVLTNGESTSSIITYTINFILET